MANVLGLSDVSSKDTGRGSSLKTGSLKRKYSMAKKHSSKDVFLRKGKSDSCVKTYVKQGMNKKDASKYCNKLWNESRRSESVVDV